FFRFQINGGAATLVNAGLSNATATLTIPLSTTQAIVSINASPDATFSNALALTPITLQVQPETKSNILQVVNPTKGAQRQSLWTTSLFAFNKALDPATVTNNIIVTNTARVITSFGLSLSNGNQTVSVIPTQPLLPGVTYTNILLPGIADLSGN